MPMSFWLLAPLSRTACSTIAWQAPPRRARRAGSRRSARPRPPRRGELLAAGLTEGPRGLQAALALAPQHRELVLAALLGGLLQLARGPAAARRPARFSPPRIAIWRSPLICSRIAICRPRIRRSAGAGRHRSRGGASRAPAKRPRRTRVLPVNESIYARRSRPSSSEAEALRPERRRSDRRPHPPRPRRGRPLADAGAAAAPARRRRGPAGVRFPAARPRARARLLACPTTACWSGPRRARAGWCRSAAWTPPKTPWPRANAAWRPARAGIKLHPRAQDFVFDGPEMEGIFALAEEAAVPILIHAGSRPAAAGRRARRPRPAPPRTRADPRPRRDLRPGHPHHAPGRPPGRALRHLLLLPARRDRAVRAGAGGADRVRLRPAVRAARDDPVHGAAGGPPGGAGRAATTRRCSAGRWRPCSTAEGCPRRRAPRRGPRIELSGRLARVYGYASLVGPALFTGAPEQAQGDARHGDRRAAGTPSRVPTGRRST